MAQAQVEWIAQRTSVDSSASQLILQVARSGGLVDRQAWTERLVEPAESATFLPGLFLQWMKVQQGVVSIPGVPISSLRGLE